VLFELLDLRPVDVSARLDAVRVRTVDQVQDVGGAEKRLRRDAAAKQARASQTVVAFDERDVLAEHRRAERHRVAAGARAHHDQVVAAVRHARSSLVSRRSDLLTLVRVRCRAILASPQEGP
jgi:hypothetical protein